MAVARAAQRFNPRPREGGDFMSGRSAKCELVSIHAPARGATINTTFLPGTSRFQSTPPRGGRQGARPTIVQNTLFQSTPPRGGRQRRGILSVSDAKFQSTPPRGGRLMLIEMITDAGAVSIHAPARGATMRA